jgi:hypothetical protein
MGERYVRNVQAGGSIPPISTNFFSTKIDFSYVWYC